MGRGRCGELKGRLVSATICDGRRFPFCRQIVCGSLYRAIRFTEFERAESARGRFRSGRYSSRTRRRILGLFDSLFGGIETTRKMTPQESFAGILLAAGACDGHISDEEAENLTTSVGRMKLFARVNEKEFSQVMDKLLGLLKKKGPEALMEACAETLPKELVNAAFANAVNIVLSDGSVDSDEKEFIENLRKKLQVEPPVAKAIAQVMVIKNKG